MTYTWNVKKSFRMHQRKLLCVYMSDLMIMVYKYSFCLGLAWFSPVFTFFSLINRSDYFNLISPYRTTFLTLPVPDPITTNIKRYTASKPTHKDHKIYICSTIIKKKRREEEEKKTTTFIIDEISWCIFIPAGYVCKTSKVIWTPIRVFTITKRKQTN